jgi:integrase
MNKAAKRTTTTTTGLRQRGEVWHIQKTIKGYGLLCESTGETDYAQALRYLEKRHAELRAVMVYGERPRVSFEDAAKRFQAEHKHLKAAERIDYALARLVPELGHLDIREIHDGPLAAYREKRAKEGASAGTINREQGVVRRILILAARVWRHPNNLAYLETAPLLRQARGEARKPYPLTYDEQAKLFVELPPHLQRAALFDVHTGLRDAELTGLRWAWEVRVPETNFPAFILPAETTKNGKERLVLLNRVARNILDEHRGQHHAFVFAYEGNPLTRLLNTAWKKARTRAELPQVRVHDLRHTFASRLRSLGVSLEDRQDLLGHAAGRTITTWYSQADILRLQESVERLSDAAYRPSVLRLVKAGADSGQPAQPPVMPLAVSR